MPSLAQGASSSSTCLQVTKAALWSSQFVASTPSCCNKEQHCQVLPYSRCELLVSVSKNPSSTPQCVKNKASTTPHSTEKAARKDEALVPGSPQPLKFPFSAPKPDACSQSKDLQQPKLQSPSASQGSIRK